MNKLILVIGEGSTVHHAGRVVLLTALPDNPNQNDWLHALNQPIDGGILLAEMIKATAMNLAGQLAAKDGELERKIRIELQIPDTGKYLDLSMEIELTPSKSSGCTIH